MTTLQRYYDFVFDELADPRVKGWILMTNPLPTLGIIALYLLSVYVFAPAYMQNRKPYSLKNVLYYYNMFQIIANTLLCYGVATSGWTTTYSFGCQPVDYSNDPLQVRMLHMVFWTYMLKMVELIETMFFIFRKKYEQVSKLHVYHHASTLMLAWIGAKYVGGGMATFPILANSFIHVIMYTYYLLTSLGPKWQKKLAPWKNKLTIAQMIQFAFLVGHSLQALHPECIVPKKLLFMYVPNVVLIAYMFWNFYRQSYLNKSSKKEYVRQGHKRR